MRCQYHKDKSSCLITVFEILVQYFFVKDYVKAGVTFVTLFFFFFSRIPFYLLLWHIHWCTMDDGRNVGNVALVHNVMAVLPGDQADNAMSQCLTEAEEAPE